MKLLTTFRVQHGKEKVTPGAAHFTSDDSSYADRILFFSSQLKEALGFAIDYCVQRGKRVEKKYKYGGGAGGGFKSATVRPRKGTPFPLPETSIMPREFREGRQAAALAEQIDLISKCMRVPALPKFKADKKYRGERKEGSARPHKTTEKQDKAIVKFVFKKRGKMKVTVSKLKQRFLWLRKLSDSLVEDRLHEAHLYYLQRRQKTYIPLNT